MKQYDVLFVCNNDVDNIISRRPPIWKTGQQQLAQGFPIEYLSTCSLSSLLLHKS